MDDTIEISDKKITTVKLDKKGQQWDNEGQKKLMNAKFHNRYAEVVQVVADGTNLVVAEHIGSSKKKKVETVTSALPNIGVRTRNKFKQSALRASDRVGLEKKFGGDASPFRTASQMTREFQTHLKETCTIFLPVCFVVTCANSEPSFYFRKTTPSEMFILVRTVPFQRMRMMMRKKGDRTIILRKK